VVILDLTLPDSSGMETFNAVKAHARDIPILILSGLDDETQAVNAVHAGAEDYLVKGRVDSELIMRAIIYAIERTESRKAVVKAEEKFRSIFENSVSGIFQTTPDGRYMNVNPALARIYGYNSQEDLMARISDIGRLLYVDPSRRTEFIRLMQEHGVIKDFESQVYRKDGSVIWISENARAVCDSNGHVLYYEGTVEDFTARKEAEDRLRFSESRFRSVWQNSSDGMRLTDELGIILAVNPSFCEIVGLRSDELVGRPFTVVYADPAEAADRMQKYQQRLAERKVGDQIEQRVAFRSGKTVDLEVSNSFIELEEGHCLNLSILRDVTIRKQAEERERMINAELSRSQAELRKQNEVLEDDLKMAREIQQAMLPQQYPTFPAGATPDNSVLYFCHRYYPTGQVGGDFFNVLKLSDSKAGLFICDVMGHGVRSALVTAMVRALVEELRPVAMDPGQLLTRINCDLRAILQQTGTPLFTTAVYMTVDVATHEVLFANAGHPRPFHLHRAKGQAETLKYPDGKARPALGLFAESTYPTASTTLAAGDMIMLFTDGLYEVEGPNNLQFTQSMLLDIVKHRADLPCSELFDVIVDEVQQFASSHEFTDDVCLLGIEAAPNF
jgi:sigma-B regulation protein RsbU (phosphoserine phosphatase)